MSLLECICCSEHRHRTAVTWDDPSQGQTCFHTYSHLLHVAGRVTSALATLPARRSPVAMRSPVAIYGRNCPSVLAAVLGVMSLTGEPLEPGESPGVGGVACFPLALDEVPADQERSLQQCEVQVVMVEGTVINAFLSSCDKWVELHLVSLDTSLLPIGLLIAHLVHAKSNDATPTRTIDPTVIQRYRQQCDTGCYACRLSAEASKIDVRLSKKTSPGSNCSTTICPSSIAYVLNTSGTTGRPKTVHVPHCCIVPNIVDLRSKFNITPDDVIFNAAPLTFDPCFVEMFLAMSTASQLLMVPDTVKASPSALSEVLFRRQYTSVLQLTPTLFYRFGEGVIRKVLGADTRVRVLAFGGEVCPSVEKLSEWKSPKNSTEVYNIYGITEVSSWATCYHIPLPPSATPSSCLLPGSPHHANQGGGVPLGEPLLGTRVEVRDTERGGVVQRGQGTIWIGGDYRVCLVGGETTHPDDSMRCSGDRGYVDGDGLLAYLGRGDSQVKRWGHRINLEVVQLDITSNMEEVSSCVLHYSDVTDSAHHVPHPSLGTDPTSHVPRPSKLTCFVVLKHRLVGKGEAMVVAKECGKGAWLLGRMKGFLSSHCIPDEVVVVDSLPVTRHGKVDISSLVNKDRHSALSFGHTHFPCPLVLSRDSVSSLLVSTICTLSDLGACPLDAKLTDLGLNSFDIVRIANQIMTELGSGGRSHGSLMAKGNEVGVSHDSHMTMLMEKLFDRKLSIVVDYIVERLVVSCDSHRMPAGEQERHGILSRVRTSSEELPSNNKRSKVDAGSKFGERSKVGLGSKVDERSSGGCEPNPNDNETDHVTDGRDRLTVESWRRGQCFVNGCLQNEEVRCTHSQVRSRAQLALGILWKVNTGKCVDASPLVVRVTRARRCRSVQKGLPVQPIGEGRAKDSQLGLVRRPTFLPTVGGGILVGDAPGGQHGDKILPTLERDARTSVILQMVSSGQRAEIPGQAAKEEDVTMEDIFNSHRTRGSVSAANFAPGVESGVTTVVYLGSHSHWFVAVEFATGRVLWRAELGDRVESSACSSWCGQYVVVGCYDGCLYVLRTDNGEIHWRFQAGGSEHPIKSSPSTDPQTGDVWFGSHDHHLYAVDIYEKRMLRKLYPGGGSIFATPCIDAKRRSIYCATLQGLMAAYNMDSGEQLWTYNAGKPIFSSPCLTPSGERVAFGSVDGTLCMLSTSSGAKMRQFDTGGCIFSSGCVLQVNDSASNSGTKLLCGSHSKFLYCWNEDLELEWKTELDSEVYSIPCYCKVQAVSGGRLKTVSHVDKIVSHNASHVDTSRETSCDCVCVCSSRGVLYLVDAASGCVVAKTALGGEVFSSPVCVDGCIVVGCRDDHVYCIYCSAENS